MQVNSLLQNLARINLSGAPFLFAYGVTWLLCGLLWVKVKPSLAALATLFQGMLALPIALLIMYLIWAFADRPETSEIDYLVILIAMSQLLALPVLIVMYRKRHYALIPVVFTIAGAVHFLMYSWLYQTVAYIIMPVLIVITTAHLYYVHADEKGFMDSGAGRVCTLTGILLILNGAYLTLSHIW